MERCGCGLDSLGRITSATAPAQPLIVITVALERRLHVTQATRNTRERKHEPMRKILLALALAAALLAGSAATAGASPATASKPAPLPVLYNLGGADAAVWNHPQVKPAIFYIFADGSAAVIDMRWARWNHSTAVTSKATDYSRTGPCCTKSDQHYHKVTVTLSDVRYRGGPRSGPYFTKMVITGHGFRTLTYTYKVFRHGSVVIGSWIGGTS